MGKLTPARQRVLEELLTAKPVKEIAATLGIAEKTVKVHSQHVFKMLGVRTRLQLLVQHHANEVAALKAKIIPF